MSKSMSPEQKALFGRRRSDDDGFTYPYGKFKGADRFGEGGYGVKSKRNIDSIGKQVRYDKRAVRAKELKRIELELVQEYGQ